MATVLLAHMDFPLIWIISQPWMIRVWRAEVNSVFTLKQRLLSLYKLFQHVQQIHPHDIGWGPFVPTHMQRHTSVPTLWVGKDSFCFFRETLCSRQNILLFSSSSAPRHPPHLSIFHFFFFFPAQLISPFLTCAASAFRCGTTMLVCFLQEDVTAVRRSSAEEQDKAVYSCAAGLVRLIHSGTFS